MYKNGNLRLYEDNTKYPVGFFMVTVIAKFIQYIEDQKQAECNPYSQPKNIEKTIPLIPFEIPQSNKNKIFKHSD